jgi:hypothetical protein
VGALPIITYGEHVTGWTPASIRPLRAKAARARGLLSPGCSMELAWQGNPADDPISHATATFFRYAQEWWNTTLPARHTSAMLPAQLLVQAYTSALERLEAANFAWNASTGPLSNALCWVHFAGWLILSPTTFVDHDAQQVSILVGSPAVARAHLLEGIRLRLGALEAERLARRTGVDPAFDVAHLWFHPFQAISRASNWTAKEKYWVRAFVAGGW